MVRVKSPTPCHLKPRVTTKERRELPVELGLGRGWRGKKWGRGPQSQE